jgi:hypothetical protein
MIGKVTAAALAVTLGSLLLIENALRADRSSAR